ncbi:MAG: nucleotidyltransferase [Cytophagales bacterium]|nr:nucleotidyltransferase [Cytophagales bacterium]
MKLSQEQEKLIANYFQDKPVLKAYVFGSYSRNEADENSDIDIMIELDPRKPIGLEFVQYILDLEKLFAKKIDLVTYKGLSKYVKPYVDEDKRLIYEQAL